MMKFNIQKIIQSKFAVVIIIIMKWEDFDSKMRYPAFKSFDMVSYEVIWWEIK